ncbi:MAG: transposase [bacterium]|nr:transposase [bacterium]
MSASQRSAADASVQSAPPQGTDAPRVRGYRLRLYPSPEIERLFRQYAGAERWIYNRSVQHQQQCAKDGAAVRALSYTELQQLAPAEAPWLAEVPARVQSQALRLAQQALRDSRAVRGRGAPRYRARRGGTIGFSWQATTGDTLQKISKRKCDLRLPTARGQAPIRCRVRVDAGRTPPPEAYRRGALLRVTRDAVGDWWVTMSAAAPAQEAAPAGTSCGLDVGIARSLTLADHTNKVVYFDAPQLLSPADWERLRRLERAMARARRTNPCDGDPCSHEPGGCWRRSNRYEHKRRHAAKLRRRARRRRGDWAERVTAHIADRYRIVAVEDLRIQAMTNSARGTIDAPGRNVGAKSGLNRAILNQAWGTTTRRLADKTAARAGEVVRVRAAYTSQRCHNCGHTVAANRPTRAVFRCQRCGHRDGADANAARNIHQQALDENPPSASGGRSPDPQTGQ